LAYGAVFLLALSEAIPVVGALVPGSALIIGISALVPAGIVKLLPLLIAAAIGAIIGDGLSYGLGHRYQTFVVVSRTNERLEDDALDTSGEVARALLTRWGNLHAVRSGASILALILMVGAI
jgi:membrane protein DedA with SNARE-associated domain